jgi:hypothetical protein
MTVTCKTCRYYVPKGLVNPGLGSCRYNPPTLSLFLTPQGATSVADFPPVNEELWCRCHEPTLAEMLSAIPNAA